MTTEEKNRVFNSGDFKSLSDSQRRIFRQVVEDLDERGIFRPTDVAIIASYARNVILARLASKELEKKMRQAAAELNFEEAARLRDRMTEVLRMLTDPESRAAADKAAIAAAANRRPGSSVLREAAGQEAAGQEAAGQEAAGQAEKRRTEWKLSGRRAGSPSAGIRICRACTSRKNNV